METPLSGHPILSYLIRSPTEQNMNQHANDGTFHFWKVFLKAKIYFMILCTSHLLTSKYVLSHASQTNLCPLVIKPGKMKFQSYFGLQWFFMRSLKLLLWVTAFLLIYMNIILFQFYYHEFSHPCCNFPPSYYARPKNHNTTD